MGVQTESCVRVISRGPQPLQSAQTGEARVLCEVVVNSSSAGSRVAPAARRACLPQAACRAIEQARAQRISKLVLYTDSMFTINGRLPRFASSVCPVDSQGNGYFLPQSGGTPV